MIKVIWLDQSEIITYAEDNNFLPVGLKLLTIENPLFYLNYVFNTFIKLRQSDK